MTQIMELMDKRAKAWEAAKAVLNSHSQNGGMVSAEDAATYDKMEKEVTDLTKDIERLQRQEQIDKMMSAPTSTPLTGKPESSKLGTRAPLSLRRKDGDYGTTGRRCQRKNGNFRCKNKPLVRIPRPLKTKTSFFAEGGGCRPAKKDA